MRLIDAERLSFVLNKNFGHTGGAAVLQQLIDDAPTVDAEKHGKWEVFSSKDETVLVCSLCGYNDYHKRIKNTEIVAKNYCPHCGAKMEKVVFKWSD